MVTIASPTHQARPTWTWTSGGGGNGTYRCKLDDPDVTVGSVEVQGTSFSPAADLGEGAHALYVQERDDAGNWSASGSAAVLVDRTPPDVPDLQVISPSSPANENQPMVLGVAEAQSTVRLYTDAACTSPVVATGTAEEFAVPGLTVLVGDNTSTTFHANATDAAGNVSDCSASGLTYLEDSEAPAPVTFTGTTPDSPANNTLPAIRGTAEVGSTVHLFTNASCTPPAVASGTAGDFASQGITVVVVDGSTTTFHATATDGAGNESACSLSSITYLEQGQAPSSCTNVGDCLRAHHAAAGFIHSCALGPAGAYCWGDYNYGKLGAGYSANQQTPSLVTSLVAPRIVAAGWAMSCAVEQDDSAWCWGWNPDGELGNGGVGTGGPTATKVLITEPVVDIEAGHRFACAIAVSGKIYCWGDNNYAQVGQGWTSERVADPRDVKGVADVRVAAAVEDAACVVIADGSILCWGKNTSTRFGFGVADETVLTPTTVPNLGPAVGVGLGRRHICALMAGTGTVECWGDNNKGQLGDGTITPSATPVVATGVVDAVALVSGADHNCVITGAAEVMCWGAKNQLGIGADVADPWPTPTVVSGLTGIATVDSNAWHTCAASSSGSTWCWGSNGNLRCSADATVTTVTTPNLIVFP